MRRFHVKRDGVFMVENDGASKYMPWWESALWHLGLHTGCVGYGGRNMYKLRRFLQEGRMAKKTKPKPCK